MVIFLLTIGFISILGQVALLRELSVALFGIELVYILAMGGWLLGAAGGAIIGRRSYIPPESAVNWLLLVLAVALPLELAFIRGARIILGGIPGAYLPFHTQLLIILLAMVPVGLVLGLLFQWAAKIYIGQRRTAAMAYAIESAGGLAGGLAATGLLAAGVHNFPAVLLCAVAASLAALRPAGGRVKAVSIIAAALSLVFVTGMFLAGRLDFEMTRWNHPDLIDTRDSPYSRISIISRGGQLVVFENDVLGLETESTTAEEFVHLAAIQPHRLKLALVLGGGVDGVIQELEKHRPRRIDYVELNPVMLEMARQHLTGHSAAFFETDSVFVHQADPRTFLARAGRYDLIMVGMPDPSSGQSNRFYTVQFFQACRDRLNPGGVLAFRLKSSENVWTRVLTYRNTSIHRTLATVFADVVVLPGATNLFLAAEDGLNRDPAVLGARFQDRNIVSRLVTPDYINYLYTNDRFQEIAGAVDATWAPLNTDSRPVCYRLSAMIWLSKFFPRMIHREAAGPPDRADVLVWSIPVVIILGVIFWTARRRPRARAVMLAGLAGLLGMVFETALILFYQVKNGVLFQNLGILLMLFMAGLTAGSILVLKINGSAGARPNRLRHTGTGLIIGFTGLNFIFMALLGSKDPAGALLIGTMMFLTGCFVAGMFACASLSGHRHQREIVPPVYAADLLGGCLGSLLGSLFLIPFLGLLPAAGLTAMACLLILILI